MSNTYQIYLISDSTGETLDRIFLALKAQFSKIDYKIWKADYSQPITERNYSNLIPSIGKLVVGEKAPYEYLVKSIENFLNQDELISLMIEKGFKKCSYRNLSGGIVSIHSGWKI